jgi:hypothetical protein
MGVIVNKPTKRPFEELSAPWQRFYKLGAKILADAARDGRLDEILKQHPELIRPKKSEPPLNNSPSEGTPTSLTIDD